MYNGLGIIILFTMLIFGVIAYVVRKDTFVLICR